MLRKLYELCCEIIVNIITALKYFKTITWFIAYFIKLIEMI